MKQLIILTYLLCTTSITYAQNDTVFIRYNENLFSQEVKYQTDTVIFELPTARKILYGTTILPWTSHQQIAKGYGLYLKKVSITKYRNNKRPPENEEVVAINETDSSLIIELNIIGNCCHDFLCDVAILENNTINLTKYSYGATYCACFCCFGLTYHFDIVKNDEYSKLKSVVIDGIVATRKKF